MAKTKLSRYHRDIFFPDWSEKAVNLFFEELSKKRSITFSTHAVDKILADSVKYGQLFAKYVLRAAQSRSYSFARVFEFYAVEQQVKKVCMRFSYDTIAVDIIIVTSLDGTVITSFTINKGDNHNSLNKSLYEKGK